MAIRIVASILESRTGLTHAQKLVLLSIADHAGPDGDDSWPSVDTIALAAEVERRSVKRILRALEDDGWIETDVQGGGSRRTRADMRPNRYRIRLERLGLDGVTDGSPRGEGRGDLRARDGVTDGSPRGVTDRSPEPSLEPSLEPSPSDAGGVDGPSDDVVALCTQLADRVEHRTGHRPKVTGQWHVEMDRLLRLGCPDWATPEPVPVDRVRRLVDYVFDHDERDPSGFCWADQIRSAPTLRRQYEKLRTWANAHLSRQSGPGVSRDWMDRTRLPQEDP